MKIFKFKQLQFLEMEVSEYTGGRGCVGHSGGAGLVRMLESNRFVDMF